MVKVQIENFKRIRIQSGFSQRGLAKAAGLSGPIISQFESGQRNPSPESASKLCKALGVDFDKIFFTPNVSKSKRNSA